MARHPFGATIADYGIAHIDGSSVFGSPGAQLLVLTPGAVVTFWTAQSGGSQIVDLAAHADGSSPVDHVTADSNGAISTQVWGPDGVASMWADGNGGAGPRVLMLAADIADLVAQLVAQVASLQAALDLSPAYVYYDTVSQSWPHRPATSKPVWFVCRAVPGVKPDPVATGAILGFDFYIGA